MNYIINPNWFYWLQLLSDSKTIIAVFSALITAGLIAAIIAACVNYAMGYRYRNDIDEDGVALDSDWSDYLLAKKFVKILFPITIICLIIYILIPSKETLISMMIAKYATKENLSMTVEGIKSAVDYIVNAMKEIKG